VVGASRTRAGLLAGPVASKGGAHASAGRFGIGGGKLGETIREKRLSVRDDALLLAYCLE
jgi:hypothetical protein